MISRINILSIAIGFLVILSWNGGYADKEIPMTRFSSQNVGGPTMTFLYW